jgi:hypothetical protein
MHCSKASLFDHLVGDREQLVRNFQVERRRRAEIDHQLEFGRLLDRQITRFSPLRMRAA